MRRKGNCWDNAVAESFLHTLKTELIYREDFGWCPSTPVMGKLAATDVIYRIFSPRLFYYGIYLSKMPRSD
jgi:transposase InsO family protein